MKRLFILLVLSLFLFNWVGYQLSITIADQHDGQKAADANLTASAITTTIPGFHILLYEKELDFDDLFEFTSSSDHTAGENYLNISNDLFSDHANTNGRPTSFKCFNGEYYFRIEQLSGYPNFCFLNVLPDPDFKLPAVFRNPQDRPPQAIG